jgi:regulator of replication initiation timing
MNELHILSPLQLSSQSGDSLPGHFSGIAYSGAFVPGYDFVVDLARTSISDDLPVLFQHDHSSLIGMITQASNSGLELFVEGDLFSDLDPAAEAIARKSARGAKYQQSVGLFGGGLERLAEAEDINGRRFEAGVYALRGAEIREVSIVSLGADKNTHARFFTPKEENSMADNAQEIIDLKSQLSAMREQAQALTQERDALRTRLEAVEAEVKAQHKAARLEAVRGLFSAIGREYSEEAAGPYMEMSAEGFAAVSADLRGMLGADSNGLFREVADRDTETGDAAGNVLLSAVRSRFGLAN